MPVRFEGDTIYFEEKCLVEEALGLVERLRAQPDSKLDLRNCEYLHTALVQTIAALKPEIIAPPGDAVLAQRLMPFFARA